MTSAYAETFAEFYDVFYREKPYAREAEFLHGQFQRFGVASGARLLELACGTGEHAIHLHRRGYDVTATDGSDSMLERARLKAKNRGANVRFARMDMREIPAADLPYDAAYCLFDSIGYAQTDGGVGAVLQGVYDSLRPNGVFAVEFWHAPAMLSGFEPVRVRRFASSDATVLRISETELDRERSLAHVTFNIYELRNDSTFRHSTEKHSNRFFTVQEMEAMGRRHGFGPLCICDGFEVAPVTDRTWHVVALLQKVASARP